MAWLSLASLPLNTESRVFLGLGTSFADQQRGQNQNYVGKWLFTLIYTFLCSQVWGKMFLRAEKPLVANCFGVPTYKQKSRFYVEVRSVQSLPAVFLQGDLRHAATFSRGSN